jgi:Flp pilus assembly protein TadD
MPTNQVTAQLRKLQEQRLVVPGGRPNLRSRYYEVKDRLFRIWLQMREDQSTRGRLRFLTEFFQRWYGHRSDELRQAAQKLADAFWHELDRGDPLRCSEHLRTLDYLRQASKERPNIVLDSLVAAVNNREDDPATLRAKLIPLEAMYRDAESEDGREDVGYVIATVENMLGDREQSLAVLSELVERGSTNGRIVSALLDRLIEDERCEEAWNKGSQVLSSHPELSRVREARAVAGIALGRIDDGLAEATRLIEETSCPNCRQRIAMRTTRELARLRQFDRALPLFRSAIGKEQADANPESMRALVDIAGGTGVTTNNFALAARFWGHLSDAPFWFLQAAICALSHRDGAASQALDFMSAAAEKVGGVLPQFAVDHLIDILAKLKASTEGDSAGRVSLERAVAFVEQHTDPRLLAVAFRNTVPGLARTRPDLRVHLLGLYSQLRDRGLLSEDISPYVEASTVILSPDREGALMGLHPEIREAVKLLLPEDEESPASAGERGSSKRRAGAQGTSRQ